MMAIMLQKVVACTNKQGRAELCASVRNYKAYTAILELVSESRVIIPCIGVKQSNIIVLPS